MEHLILKEKNDQIGSFKITEETLTVSEKLSEWSKKMKINVSPMFAEPLGDINKIMIEWEEHKLTEAEARKSINDIFTYVFQREVRDG